MSTFNAGAIEASLTLGRSNWVRDLKKTKKEIEDLEHQTITIGVDLDTDNARVSMDNLEMFLDDFDQKTYTPEIDLIVNEAMTKLEELEARLDALDARRVVVEADLDADNALIALDNLEGIIDVLENDPLTITANTDFEEAYFNLDALEENIDLLDGRTINIDADVDMGMATAELAALEAEVSALDGRQIDINVDVDQDTLGGLVGAGESGGGGGSLGLLKILLLALIALSPIVAVATSAAGAAIIGLAAALSGAAGAVGVLGIGLFGLIKRYKDAKKAGKDMIGPMGDFADSIKDLSKAWNGFLDHIDDAGFNLMADAIDIVAKVLPTLAPLFNTVAEAIDGVLGSIKDWIGSAEYQRMLDFFGGFGVDMLITFLHIGGNLIRFFGYLFEAIEPFAREMMSGLERLTAGWLEWSKGLNDNPAFQRFMDNALTFGPMVLDMLGSLIQAFANLGRALEPFAGPMLQGLIFGLDFIANLDPDLLSGLIAGFTGLFLAIKLIGPVTTIATGALEGLTAVLGVLSAPVILIGVAIAGLIATIIYLWKTNEEFRDAVIKTWNTIVEHIKPIIEDITNIIMENWGPIKEWAMEIWGDIQSTVVDAMVSIQQLTIAVMNTITFLWENFGDDIVRVVKGFVQIIGGNLKGFFQIISGLFHLIRSVLTGDWKGMWEGIKQIGRGAISIFTGLFRGLVNIWGGIFHAIGKALTGAWNGAMDGLENAWNGFRTWIENQWHNLINWFGNLGPRIGHATAGMWDGISNAFRGVINDMIGWWNNLSFSVDIPNAIPGLPNSFTISTPDIPTLAKGAYLTDATLAIAGEAGPEIVAPEPVLERIVRENSGAQMDYGRLAAAVAAALGTVWSKMGGGITQADLERLIEAASVNLNIDARSDHEAAGRLASAIGYELRILGYGGKANV